MSSVYSFSRGDLERELSNALREEATIDRELIESFTTLSLPSSSSSNSSSSSSSSSASSTSLSSSASSSSSSSRTAAFESSSDLSLNVKKVEAYVPAFEAMSETSKKLVFQVDECNALSDRLSKKVRKLNRMQKNALEALNLTENIMSMKEKRAGISDAINEGKYMHAVKLVQDVMSFDVRILETSEDFAHINILKDELREKVRSSFAAAINSSNLDEVMNLCPGLQTLGLEVEARDMFIEFMANSKVFKAVSADAVVAKDELDTAPAYVESLSNLFNSSHAILQKYLPMVIQGMLNSNGDIIFIQKLHSKCETEAFLILKRYIHFRKANEMLDAIKVSGQGGNARINQSEVHTLLDELSLLIQYCCVFSRYIGHLCEGAEHRGRPPIGTSSSTSSSNNSNSNSNSIGSSNSNNTVKVFSEATELEKKTQQLIINYYIVAERWILKNCVLSALPRVVNDSSGQQLGKWNPASLDDCFFVLLRTGQRAVACNSFFAADCVLTEIIGLLAKADDLGNEAKQPDDLLTQASNYLEYSATKLILQLQEHLQQFLKTSNTNNSGTANDANAAMDSSSAWLKSLMSLSSGSSSSASATASSSNAVQQSQRNSPNNLTSKDDEDIWNVSSLVESFNVVEKCTKYCDRLSKDLLSSAAQVFVEKHYVNPNTKQHVTEDSKRLNLRKEEFDRAKLSFHTVLRNGMDRIKHAVQNLLKDLLSLNLGKKGPLGGVRFDLPETEFDSQPALSLLPKLLTIPIDTIIGICTTGLSENNKDLMVSLLADSCSDELINYISQNTFRFSGALKFEEVARSITSIFTRASSSPIRGKFSRLREILLVLTSSDKDSVRSGSFMFNENFTTLTPQEIQTFADRRLD